jgi:hypothetical protein
LQSPDHTGEINNTFFTKLIVWLTFGTPIAAGVAEKLAHILRKPASRRASRGLVDATRGSPHHPQMGQRSYFLVSVGVVRGALRFDDMCGVIPSPPLTAFPRRLY